MDVTRRRGRPTFARKDLAVACLAAAVVISVGLFSAREIWLLHDERRDVEDARVLASVAVGVALDVERATTAIQTAALNVTAPIPIDPSRVAVPGASAVGLISADPDRHDAGSVLPDSAAAGREISALLDRARDSGDMVLSGPVAEGNSYRTLIVTAAYTRDPQVGRPSTVVQRRARLAGWVVATIDLREILRAHLPAGSRGSISEGSAQVAVGEGAPSVNLPGTRISIADHRFVIRTDSGSQEGIPGSAVLVGLAGVLLGLVVGMGVLLNRQRTRELRHAVARRSAQVELIGEVAPLVQQSLELAEVLPAVAIQLSDHFGLIGVSVSTGASEGDRVGLFTMGVSPDPSAQAVLRPPQELPAGETLVLAMHRGDRSVARLGLVAGRDLDAEDLQSLRAITELMTAAVVNASLYASQQEALRNLRDLDALKTVFLGTASHELRTPATAITGFASLLITSWDRFDDGQRRDFAARIEANARSLSAVVQDLLDFSLLDGGEVTMTFEPIDVGALVSSVAERLAPIFTGHSIVVSVEPAPVIEGDVHALERALTNLLTNAAKFSPSGTTVSVSAGPTEDASSAEIVVSDEGPGIPREERARVFTRFYRGAGDAVVQTRGVGIGLSVVSELVVRMRGEVLVDDAPGGGARFTIRLPGMAHPSTHKESEDAPTT